MNQWKVKKKMKNRSLILMMILSLMLGMVHTVLASSDYEPDRKGSIIATLEDLGTVREGVKLSLYQVGTVSVDQYLSYVIDSELESAGVDLNELTTAESVTAAASTLAEVVVSTSITPLTGVTDESGSVSFTELEQGMYLLMPAELTDYGIISPSLIAVPYVENGETWQYDIPVVPKASSIIPDASISVTKEIYQIGEDLELTELYTEDATYYVGLFMDANATVPYGNDYVQAIHIVNGSSGTVTYTDLPKGTYYIRETDANGNPLPLNTEMTDDQGNSYACVIVGDDEEVPNRVMVDPQTTDSGAVTVRNQYYDIPDPYSIRANIDITKKVIKNNVTTTVNDTFYAGVFRTESNGDLTLVGSVVTLTQNGTRTVEVPLGGENGDEEITYSIYETDAQGNPIDHDAFAYTVSGEGTVTVSQDSNRGALTITNTVSETTTPTPTGSTPYFGSTPTPIPGGGDSSSTPSVRTGDDTPILIWILIAAAAVVVIGIVAVRRNKKKS